jgi:hypothetical protein
MLQIDPMFYLGNATAPDTEIIDDLSLVEIIKPLLKNVILGSPCSVVKNRYQAPRYIQNVNRRHEAYKYCPLLQLEVGVLHRDWT